MGPDPSGHKEISMLRFHIPTMTCGGCVKSISRAVAALDPHARVDADLQSHDVEITTAADEGAVVAALREVGYEPRTGAAPGERR
jgi:copper chaperone